MTSWEQAETDAANERLRAVMYEIQDDFDREIGELGEIHRKLAALKVHATSPAELAKVTVNSSGLVLEVTIADDAFRRCTPRELTDDLNAAIQGAVDAAAGARESILAPIQAIVDGIPDLSDVIPGAPSIRDLQARLAPPIDAADPVGPD